MTGLSLSFASATVVNEANMADINDFVKAMRNSGISVTAKSTWNVSAGATSPTTYSVQLIGEAAQKFTINALSGATSGVFTVANKEGVVLGTITAANYRHVATSSTNYSNTVVFNATKVTAAASTSVSAAYYDRDGNQIAVNELSNYFTVSYSGRSDNTGTIYALASAATVYDAVGNVTTLNANEIYGIRDIIGAMQVKLHVGADATSNNQITMNLRSSCSCWAGGCWAAACWWAPWPP